MSDFRSILEMMPDEHCMVEPFIESQGDLNLGRQYVPIGEVDKIDLNSKCSSFQMNVSSCYYKA